MPTEHPNALPPGYTLHWYRVEKVLGQGGFGITYLARDTNLDKLVAIKEYLPVEFAARGEGQTVQPRSGAHGDKYAWGLDRFIKEARMLSGFDHPNIVHVHSVFEFNATAYMVMRFEQGRNLHEVIGANENLSESLLKQVLFPILDGLEVVHAAGFIHRDIKPDNVYLRDDGTPVLLDFGSARQSFGDSRTLTILVAPGYAPFEQYYSGGSQQGPWTDLYSLGATLYHAVSRFPPVDAIARSKGILGSTRDILVPAVQIGAGRYSPRFLAAIDHALRFNEKDRPQSISEWRAEFLGDSRPENGPPPAGAKDRHGESDADDATTRPYAVPAAAPADRAESRPTLLHPTVAGSPPPAAASRTGGWKRVAGAAAIVVLVGFAAWPHLGPRPPAAADRPAAAAEPAPGTARRVEELEATVVQLEAARERAESARAEAERAAGSERERGSALRERLAALEAKITESGSAAPAPAVQDVQALRQARDEAERAAQAERDRGKALRERIVALEANVTEAESAAQAERERGKASRERIAALEASVAEAESAAQAERERGKALRERIAALEASVAGAGSAATTRAAQQAEALGQARDERDRAESARAQAESRAQALERRATETAALHERLAGESAELARRAKALEARERGLEAERERLAAESARLPAAPRPAVPAPTPAPAPSAEPAARAAAPVPAPAAAGPDAGLAEGLAAYRAGSFAAARERLRPLAEAGDDTARYHVGLMHALGQGTPVNDAEAVRWYRLAADQGHAGAQNSLGVMYAAGRGVERDDSAAAGWYEKAAKQGHVEAQANLGRLFEIGRGLPRDDFQAYGWYFLAAEAGNDAARRKLEQIAGRLQPLERSHAEKLFAAFRAKRK